MRCLIISAVPSIFVSRFWETGSEFLRYFITILAMDNVILLKYGYGGAEKMNQVDSVEQKNALILIGGASGVGKTILAIAMEEQGAAVYKKLHNLTLDTAREMGVDVKTVIAQMDDSIVIKKMIALVREYYCVVTDLHFAIQPRTDTNILVEGKSEDEKLLATEEYAPAFKAAELSAISSSGITLVPILITCDVDSLVQRRYKNTARAPKSLNREIVRQELSAEMAIYLSTISRLGLEPQIFTNADNQFAKLKGEVVSLIESIRGIRP